MKNVLKLIGIIALAAVIGFSFAACDNGSGSGGGGGPSYNNDPGDFAGTWTGTATINGTPNVSFTVTVSSSGWTISVPSQNYADTGNFNRNGNTAQLYNANVNVGTATFVNANTITVVLNQQSIAPGTYTMTKQQ